MKSSWLSPKTLLAAVIGLSLGLVCQRAFRGGEQRGIQDSSAARPTRDHSSQPATAPLVTGPTTALLRRIPQASAEECEVLVRELLENQERGKEIELEAIFRRWLALESPVSVLKKVNDFDDQRRNDYNASFFLAWVALDEKAAMAETRYTQLNPARALYAIRNADPNFAKYCVNTDHSFSFGEKAQAALTALARNRPDIAHLIADAKISEDLKINGITAVARGLAVNDPEGAIVWLQSLGLADPDRHFDAVFSEWLKIDPAAANKAQERLGFSRLPEVAISRIRMELRQDPFIDIAGFHQKLIESGANLEDKYFQLFGSNWFDWQGLDPESDARAVAGLPAGKARDFLMNMVFEKLLSDDRGAAMRYAEKQGLDSPTIRRLKNLTTDEMRKAALSSPEKYFANLFVSGETNEVHSEQMYDLANEWSAADPIAAAEWLITQDLPSGDNLAGIKANAFRSGVFGNNWANHDPIGASRWMEELPDGPRKSSAWEAMEHYVNQYSPDMAFSLSAAYLKGDSRGELLTKELVAVRDKIGLPAALDLLKLPDLSAIESAALAAALKAVKGGDQ